jgi:hypothetical protein
MNIHVIYRLCDKVDAVNGLARPFGLTKAKVIQACFRSLVKSFGKSPWAMTILADDVTQGTKDFISSNSPEDFKLFDITPKVKEDNGQLPVVPIPFVTSGALYNSAYIRILESNPPLKNAGSLQRAYEVADSIEDENTWIYFLEDDYFHDWNSFLVKLVDFANFVQTYQFALPIFIHPSDYPDQYSRLLSRCYLFQTRSGYWREVCSTTGTFMCQAKTYRKFADHIKSCGTDDGKLSSIFKKEALCFSPLPGYATHMHEGVMSNYVNWEAMVKEVLAESSPKETVAVQ